MKNNQELLKKSFQFSKKGKIITSVETTFCFGIFGLVVVCLIVFLFIYLPSRGEIPLSVVKHIARFMIISVTVVGTILGFFMSRVVTISFIAWRFFKPSSDDVKKYIQSEIKRVEGVILADKQYKNNLEARLPDKIKELKEKTAKSIANSEENIKKLELSLDDLKLALA
jgi:hypothetical protein